MWFGTFLVVQTSILALNLQLGLEQREQINFIGRSDGVVTVAQPIDHESQSGISNNEIKFSVVIQDKVDEGVDNPLSYFDIDTNSGELNNEPTIFNKKEYKVTIHENVP